MAQTRSSEVEIVPDFNWNAQTITVQSSSDLNGTLLSAIAVGDVRGVLRIQDPNGVSYYNNTNQASPDITSTVNGSVITSITASTDEIAIASHGYSTGQPIVYSDGGGTTIGGLTDLNNYFAIKVDANTLKLAESAALAQAGTAVDLTGSLTGAAHTFYYLGGTVAVQTSGGEPLTGEYVIKMSLYDVGSTANTFFETLFLDYQYARPTISLDISHSVIKPIFFKSIDETSYGIGGVTPEIQRAHTLYNPPSIGGNSQSTLKALNVNEFYTTTSQVKLQATTKYVFANAFYGGNTSATSEEWVASDVFSSMQDYTVDGVNSVADKYDAMKSLWDRVEASRSANRGDYTVLKSNFELASSNYQMLEAALNSGKSQDFNGYALEINRLTGYTSSVTATQVYGIGTTADLVRKYTTTLSGSTTSWTPLDTNSNPALVGYTDDDIIFFVDDTYGDGVSSVSASLNPSTGTLTYSNSLSSGVNTVYIIKP